MHSAPRVSIGLIVYNGENYLAAAIDSLLDQSFSDFELIISDNGSSDATGAICRDYAARDPRIRYYRSAENHGATWNHNRVIELARGEFFKLAAHDDLCEPRFLEACVAALDDDPGTVLAFTDAKLMRGDYRGSMQIHRHALATDSPSAAVRFGDMIEAAFQGFQVFGCIRTAVLRRIRPFGPWKGADRLVMAELALQGPFAQVRENLFIYRLHRQQSIAMVDKPAEYIAWWRSGDAPARIYPQWRFLRELLGMVRRAPLPWAEKRRCFAAVMVWARQRRAELWRELRGTGSPAHATQARPASRGGS